jgi:hypothetical protein
MRHKINKKGFFEMSDIVGAILIILIIVLFGIILWLTAKHKQTGFEDRATILFQNTKSINCMRMELKQTPQWGDYDFPEELKTGISLIDYISIYYSADLTHYKSFLRRFMYKYDLIYLEFDGQEQYDYKDDSKNAPSMADSKWRAIAEKLYSMKKSQDYYYVPMLDGTVKKVQIIC